jgi:hypothetical protein
MSGAIRENKAQLPAEIEDREALTGIVDKWWSSARTDALMGKAMTELTDEDLASVKDRMAEDRTSHFRALIKDVTEMTTLLARLLHDRGETPADPAIIFVQNGGLVKTPRSVLVAERTWRAHLSALSAAPTAETIVSESINFYSELGKSFTAAEISLEVTL